MYGGVFFAALIVSLVLTPLAGRLGRRWGMVARPGGRRRHEGPLSNLGGVPILLGWLAGVVLIYLWLPPTHSDDALRVRGVVLGAIFVFVAGFCDDRWELPAGTLFVAQVIAAGIAFYHIVFIEIFTNPFSGEAIIVAWKWVVFLITFFWIVGMMNAVNFMDGLDGLAAGVGVVAAVLFAWHGHRLGQTTVALFPLALAGALLGFLPYNFARATIFLGGGAYLLGYLLATLSILSPARIATAMLVLIIPIVDVAWLIIDRLRRGKRPWDGDRGHLHFRLADAGVPARVIVLSYYALAVIPGLAAVLIPSPLAKLLVLIGMVTAVLSLLIFLSRRTVPRPPL